MKYKLIFFFNISLKSNSRTPKVFTIRLQYDVPYATKWRYLKTSIRWGGGFSLTPPLLNPMFDVQIWQMMHHWKACALLLESAKKMCKLGLNIFFAVNWPFKFIECFSTYFFNIVDTLQYVLAYNCSTCCLLLT